MRRPLIKSHQNPVIQYVVSMTFLQMHGGTNAMQMHGEEGENASIQMITVKDLNFAFLVSIS
jgi:hypothetical protein